MDRVCPQDKFSVSLVYDRHFNKQDFQEPGPEGERRPLKPRAVPGLFDWTQYRVPRSVEADGAVEDLEAFLTEHNYALVPDPEVVLRPKQRIQQRFGLQRFAGSDEDIRFFTRFASYELLMGFWASIEHLVPLVVSMKNTQRDVLTETSVPAVPSLQPIDEMFLLLNYLALGSKLKDLADRFGIQQSTVSQIITTWSNFLYTVLGSINIWIPNKKITEHLPAEFEDYADTAVILNCTELRYQSPSSSLLESEELATHCTLKGLFGVAPHGAVTFISQLYAESVSNDHLIQKSGILSLLRPGMAIMVDQGFLVDDFALCEIYMLPFLSLKSQMSACDVRETQAIARLSAHVEHLIGRVKDHGFFDTEIPLQLLHNINQLYTVACLLTNYESELLGKAEA
ncbi:uncharacterized protein LOC103364065 [Stegastes partitus]|uniref:Uncharacterized LOC103364065 n=1 Tax=Stegastes partitus TaxID=144197 RepID=A0A3B5AJ68_9TELE|nr:PREDICTED: uncharacterized protein LOC103364065 [Stegastes partitus]